MGTLDGPTKGSGDESFDREEGFNNFSNSESRTPLKTPSKENEVKFTVVDSANGDAKVDIGDMKAGFVGMSKEELLKYVDDPFWKKVRLVLFILFWGIWVVMFVTAICIIIIAPRCPKKRTWYEEGPILDIDLPKQSNSLQQVTNKLDYFKTLNVKSLILSPVFPADEKGNAIDFETVGTEYGTLEDLKNLIEQAKKKAVRILLTLVPNHSSLQHVWFNKSQSKDPEYIDYYVWAPEKATPETGPPNNWLSATGGSAWKWDETRKQYYLHQLDEGQPDLNYVNPAVVQRMNKVLEYWLNLGVSGFNFDKIQYLVEDAKLTNEVPGSRVGFTQNEYEFWNHLHTYNHHTTANILEAWRNVTRERTNNDGIVVITGVSPIAENMNQTASPDLVRAQTLIDGSGDLPNPNVLLERVIKRFLNQGWPAVEATPKGTSLSSLGSSNVDLLNTLTLLLPGTPVFRLGDERGFSADESAAFLGSVEHPDNMTGQNHYNLFKTLAGDRSSPALLLGSHNVTVKDEVVLVLSRWKAGTPGFLALWNSSPELVTLNLTEFVHLPPELTVLASGNPDVLSLNSRVATAQLPLAPYLTAVFTFVPADVE